MPELEDRRDQVDGAELEFNGLIAVGENCWCIEVSVGSVMTPSAFINPIPHSVPKSRISVSTTTMWPRRLSDPATAARAAIVLPPMPKTIRQPKPIGDRRFEIEFIDAAMEAFEFTLG
ncbi:MAG: hypothetical protein HOP16_17380 [Acidobacteria bacterium]|nr:hypothetical protein [Acidobacteriota bacterium]